MSSATELYLPPTLPYPIKIISLHAVPNDSISRGTCLLAYSFISLSTSDLDGSPAEPETRFGTWDSPIEGELERWHVKKDDLLSAKRARERPVISIIEPCKHGIQMGGLCALCGKDVTE